MNAPKVDELDYIHFLIAAQHAFTATEAAKSHPDGEARLPCDFRLYNKQYFLKLPRKMSSATCQMKLALSVNEIAAG